MAQEIFQQTQFRLWEQFDEFDSTKDFGAWACTIAHYLILTDRKRGVRRRKVFSEPAFGRPADRSLRSPNENESLTDEVFRLADACLHDWASPEDVARSTFPP